MIADSKSGVGDLDGAIEVRAKFSREPVQSTIGTLVGFVGLLAYGNLGMRMSYAAVEKTHATPRSKLR